MEIGDKVTVTTRHGSTFDTVERFTKTQLITDGGDRFNRHTLQRIGGGQWDFKTIRLTTEQDLIERKVSNKRIAMCRQLNSLKVSEMSLTQLNNLEAALRGF